MGETTGEVVLDEQPGDPCKACKVGTIRTEELGFQPGFGSATRGGQTGAFWSQDVCDNPECWTNDGNLTPAADPQSGATLHRTV